jgi:hypothetical protein
MGSMLETATVAYVGATEGELREMSSGRKAAGLNWQRSWFTHRGTLRLEPDQLALDGWLDVRRDTITDVELGFTDAYTRFMAGGIRANWPSLGIFGSLGKPLVVRRTEGREPLYLLLNYRPFLGVNSNGAWFRRLQEWLARTA